MATLAVVTALALVGVYRYWTGPQGSARLLSLALQAANEAIAGTLEAGGLSLGFRKLSLHQVVLKDPNGRRVFSVDEVDARFSLWPLLRRTIRLDQVTLSGIDVLLESGPDGFNLSSALRSRNPRGTGPQKRLTVEVEDLLVTHGTFRHRELLAEEVRVTGRGAFDKLTDRLNLKLDLSGVTRTPFDAPVSASVDLDTRGEDEAAIVTTQVGRSALRVRVRATGLDWSDLFVDEAILHPEFARTWVEDYPLKVPVRAQGNVHRSQFGITVSAQASASATHGTLRIEPSEGQARRYLLELANVNLAELVENGPPSDFGLTLETEGTGETPSEFEGTIAVKVSPSRLRGETLGPLNAKGRIRKEKLELEELVALLPGLRLTGRGEAARRHLDLRGRLEAQDLAAASRVLARFVGKRGPAIEGQGAFLFHLHGTPSHPAAEIDGVFETFRYESVAAQELAVRATAEDLAQPWESDASLSAARLDISGGRLRDVRATFSARGRELSADLSGKGLGELAARLRGQLDEDRKGLVFQEVSLAFPEASWHLDGTAHVGNAKGTLVLEPVRLVSGNQALTLSGTKGPRRAEGQVVVRAVDLARLPRALFPPDLGLAGVVDGQATGEVEGTRWRLEGTVKVAHGGFRQQQGLDVVLSGSASSDRAKGELSASQGATTLKSNFDMPLGQWRSRPSEPVLLNVDVRGLDLGSWLATFGRSETAQGLFRAKMELAGHTPSPSYRLAADGDDVRLGRIPFARLHSTAEGDWTSPISMRTDVSALGGSGFAFLRAPYSPERLLERLPTQEELRTAKFAFEADLKNLVLRELRAARLVDLDFDGLASARAWGTASVEEPEGNVAISVTRLRLHQGRAVDLQVEGATTLRETTASATVSEGQTERVTGTAWLGGGGRVLTNLKALEQASIKSKWTLHRVSFADLRSLLGVASEEESTERKTAQVEGELSGTLEVDGSLASPVAKLEANVGEVGLGSQAIGQGRVQGHYGNQRLELDSNLSSSQGGTLTAHGSGKIDLSLAALRKGVDVRAIPIRADFAAKSFRPDFLSGALPRVRRLSGTVDGEGSVGGTLGAPALRGQAEWRDGLLVLERYGLYQRIHLAALATEERIVVSELSAHAGGGSLTSNAEAVFQGDGWNLAGEISATHFPLVSDDQLLGDLTATGTFHGHATRTLVDFSELKVPQAKLELPQVKKKDLQPLPHPEDIVLLRNGKEIGTSSRRARLAREAGSQGAAPSRETLYRVVVDAPSNLWIKGSDVDAEVGLSNGFRFEYQDEASLFGELKVLRGHAEVLGRPFEVQKDSLVRFTGPPLLPYYNLTAAHVNEREQVTVFVAIRGQGKEVTLKPSSQPPMSETEIYTLLATGRRTLKRGSGATLTGAEAASAVGSIAAAQLKRAVAKQVPVDVLSIEAADEGITGARAEVGKYVSRKSYVGVAVQPGADATRGQNSYSVRWEFQISPKWNLETEVGNAAQSSDLIWSRDF